MAQALREMVSGQAKGLRPLDEHEERRFVRKGHEERWTARDKHITQSGPDTQLTIRDTQLARRNTQFVSYTIKNRRCP